MSDIEFKNAQDTVRRLAYRPSNARMLQLYALFKQATVGDCSLSQPGPDDLAGRAKYQAWNELRGMQADEAKRKYADLVRFLASKPKQALV